ncbi:MAG: heme exporter protein CcmD [Stellaceae bacterium]
MEQFFAMGGYARFVWPAYGVAVIVLVGLLVHSLAGYRRAQRALDAEEQR